MDTEYRGSVEWSEDSELESFIHRMMASTSKELRFLDILQRDFPQYASSLCTLDRRLKHFGIKFIDYGINVDKDREAFNTEKDGPGQLWSTV